MNPFFRNGFRSNLSSSSELGTPVSSGAATPSSVDYQEDIVAPISESSSFSEKLKHHSSFQKAELAPSAIAKYIPRAGLSREHQEQGQVKLSVYRHYLQAASKTSFGLFLLATIAQQGTSVLATIILRYWGEHNRQNGSNAGMLRFLLFYGVFSLSSSILGAISAILMWVYCALRSAKKLHDSVRLCLYSSMYG